MSKKLYNKLVRDKIPEIIKSKGGNPVVRQLDEKEYLRCLIDKLKEETAEFESDLSIDELADVQEVILALADAIDRSKEELEEARLEKATRRGAFRKRIYLESVQQ